MMGCYGTAVRNALAAAALLIATPASIAQTSSVLAQHKANPAPLDRAFSG